MTFSTTTGLQHWQTEDVTDLDYTPRPFLRRDNRESDGNIPGIEGVAHQSFAPSGFMGEMGAPRTVVATVGVRF